MYYRFSEPADRTFRVVEIHDFSELFRFCSIVDAVLDSAVLVRPDGTFAIAAEHQNTWHLNETDCVVLVLETGTVALASPGGARSYVTRVGQTWPDGWA